MKKKILIILLSLIFIYCIGGVIYSVVVRQSTSNKDKENENIITINNYDYTLNADNVTSLYKKEFNSLKNNLESSEVDYNNYVTSIAKLYIIDLYTLSIKSNKYDITSSQYVYSLGRENFKLKVSETLYKFIEDNTDGRKQEFPEVSEVIIDSVEDATYTIEATNFVAYNVKVHWLYKKDLEYDEDAILTLIRDNNIISVVEENRVEDLEEQKNS